MGRSAKYFTVEAKCAAKRRQAAACRRSESGKASKSRANQCYHARQQELRGSERALAVLDVTIPPELTARAKKTLRPCLAIRGYGMVLWPPPRYRWFQPPSYMLHHMLLPTTRSIAGVWETRAAVLGSYQWWAMIEDCEARAAWWTMVPVSVLHREVTLEVYKRVAGWVELRQSQGDPKEDEEYVREVGLDWGAKLIWCPMRHWSAYRNYCVHAS
ncbi:hypothetical protein C8T65DRAFT_701806 [Cerioporus squamosus]|nr:hypothetical protein C8T65DRAFT_701806 [Cerioporus squamosus]